MPTTPLAAVVGAGHTRFGALDLGPRELMREAVGLAVASVDKGFETSAVQEAFLGTVGFSGWQLGNVSAELAEEAGIAPVPVNRLENACASSGFALRAAVQAVRSRAREVVLVVGLEKMTDVPSARRRYWLGVSGDSEWERAAGLTFAGVYGLMASRYLHDYHVPRDALAEVAVKNHDNGRLNPNAHFQKAVSRSQVLDAPRVADPLGLLDCCPVSDGAVALIVTHPDRARSFTDTPAYVAGIGAGSDALALQDRTSLTSLAATRRAAQEAFQGSGLDPKSMSFLEVHDCFTIAELLALEDLGYAPRGGAGEMTLAGTTRRTAALPVNPDGGLKAKGHPLGATGASQAYEAFVQLRRAAGARQIPGAERALAHNVGGSGASAVVTLFTAG